MTELPEVLPATGAAGLAWLLFALPAFGARRPAARSAAGPTGGATGSVSRPSRRRSSSAC